MYKRDQLRLYFLGFCLHSRDRNPENRVLIDRVYTSAPVNAIGGMMNNLFTFIGTSTLSTSLKAIITFFYINYVKPFSKYSEEMAILMAKAILAHEAFGETVVDLPLEKLLLLPSEEAARIYVEVQKTSDITYFVNYVFKYLSRYCEDFLDEITKSKVTELKEDFYQVDEKLEEVEVPAEPAQPEKFETIDLFAASEEPKQEQPIVQPVSSNEEVEEQPVIQPKKKTVKVTYVQEELAVAYIPVSSVEFSFAFFKFRISF